MLLGLSKIIDCPGGVVPFETTLDLSQMDFGGCCPLHEPVHAKGSVRNTAGVLILTAEIDAVLDGVCDRCCKPFHRPFTLPLEAVLVTKLESDQLDSPWVFELVGDDADLDDIFTTAVVLNMDSKLLCKLPPLRQGSQRRFLRLQARARLQAPGAREAPQEVDNMPLRHFNQGGVPNGSTQV